MDELRNVKKLPNFSKSEDGFTRQDVAMAFQRAFQTVGGVQRLALYANENFGEFMKLYARLLPSTAVVLGDAAVQRIVHAIGPTALDEHPTVTPQEQKVG